MHTQTTQNPALERATIGALLISGPDHVPALGLTEEDFTAESHRELFISLQKQPMGRAVDPLLLLSDLEQRGKAEIVGGITALAAIISEQYSAANLGQYARVLKGLAQKRRLIAALQEGIATLTSPSEDEPEELAEAVAEAVREAAFSRQQSGFRSAAEVTETMLRKLQENRENKAYLPTGFFAIDRLIGGLRNGGLYILAARPAMGKSALAMNTAVNISHLVKQRGLGPVAILSMEMSAEDLHQRVISGDAKIQVGQIEEMTFPPEMMPDFEASVARNAALHICYKAVPNETVDGLRSEIARMAANPEVGKPSLIVTDYLQLMEVKGGGDKAGGNRQQVISQISRGLKALAMEFDIPVLALSQLSRMVEAREDKMPKLSDLRESGAIEQDADVVMFIYRDDYYANLENRESTKPGVADVNVAKNRRGSTGIAEIAFDSNFTLFRNFEPVLLG